jgi:hypothetical protein
LRTARDGVDDIVPTNRATAAGLSTSPALVGHGAEHRHFGV